MIIVLVVPFGGWFCVKEKSWIREFKARVCAALNYSLVAVVQGMALLLRAVVVQGTPTSTCDSVHSAGRKQSHTTSLCPCAFVVCNTASLVSDSLPLHIK